MDKDIKERFINFTLFKNPMTDRELRRHAGIFLALWVGSIAFFLAIIILAAYFG